MKQTVLYNDWHSEFTVAVDSELYQRIINSKQPWRIPFQILIADNKTKVEQLISSEFIHLPN